MMDKQGLFIFVFYFTAATCFDYIRLEYLGNESNQECV